MKAVITTKGQVTIPQGIRRRLNLHPGQVLEFDEKAPFVKATKAVARDRMKAVIGIAARDLAGRTTREWLDDLRGPVALPRRRRKA